ncbi:hypothetical protein ACFWVU_02140 [Streptomyces sp. NPDC058686]|uniref:hypothetical protein n=1 Tax=Streptomyces sp. NPDC058686 TaxID=3346599 RepID=UPI00365B2506
MTWTVAEVGKGPSTYILFRYGNAPTRASMSVTYMLSRTTWRRSREYLARQLPRRAETHDGAITGRGLLLVEAPATRWGTKSRAQTGKTVWAELSRSAPAGSGGEKRKREVPVEKISTGTLTGVRGGT